MWVSHKPYCGMGEGNKPLIFFETPLSRKEYLLGVRECSELGNSPRKREIAEMLKKRTDDELWAHYTNVTRGREQDWNIQQEVSSTRCTIVRIAHNTGIAHLVPALPCIYGRAIPLYPTFLSSARDLEIASPYLFASLNYETFLYSHTFGRHRVDAGAPLISLTSLWDRVEKEVRIMEKKGVKVPGLFTLMDDYLKSVQKNSSSLGFESQTRIVM